MSITPLGLFPPQPATTRAQALRLSYDSKNDRLCYPLGKSVIVRPVDPKSLLPLIQFSKHIYPVTAAAFAPSGNYVASGDESGNVKIWDTSISNDKESFEPPHIKSEFQVLSGPIRSISWDADSQRIIAVGQGKDKFGHCFTWDSGNSIGEIQGHSAAINAVDIKPQRPYRAATVGDDKALVFFNGPPFKFDKSLRDHSNTVRDVRFSPDGKYLASVGSDRLIVIYDGKTGDFIKKIDAAHQGGIFGISWLPNTPDQFVTCSADNTLKTWDVNTEFIESYTISKEVTVQDQQLGVVATPKYLVSLSTNGNLNYFEYSNGTPITVVSGVQTSITATSYDEKLLIGSSDGSLVKISLDLDKNFIAEPSLNAAHSNYVVSVLQTDSGVLTAGWDDTIKLWKDGTLVSTTSLLEQPKKIVKISSSVLVLFESKIEIYSISSEGLTKTTDQSLTFSSSDVSVYGNQILLNNLSKNSVEEFTFSDGSLTQSKSFPALRAAPTLIRISPDGKYAAVADNTGKYTLYNTADASVVTTRWAFHSSKVLDAQWTPDSAFIVSGGLDTGILIYSVARPAKVLKFLLAHQTGVSGLQWTSYDAEKKTATFISTGLDGVVKSWVVDLSVY